MCAGQPTPAPQQQQQRQQTDPLLLALIDIRRMTSPSLSGAFRPGDRAIWETANAAIAKATGVTP